MFGNKWQLTGVRCGLYSRFPYIKTTLICCSNVTGEEWALYTQQTIDRAAKELVSGRPIRSYINQLLKQVIEDLWKQYYVTNDAFSRRIAEYKEAKAKLENKHFEVEFSFLMVESFATLFWIAKYFILVTFNTNFRPKLY